MWNPIFLGLLILKNEMRFRRASLADKIETGLPAQVSSGMLRGGRYA